MPPGERANRGAARQLIPSGMVEGDPVSVTIHEALAIGKETYPGLTGNSSSTERDKVKAVVATEEHISRAPIGNSNHRIWKCQAQPMKGARQKWSRKEDREN